MKMAKKKIDYKNVKINQEGLSTTVIGELPNEKKGPIFVLFLFILLLAIVFFLPDIVDFINEKNNKVVVDPSTSNPSTSDNNPSEGENAEIYELSENLSITLDKVLTINNFKIEDNKISYTITNQGENRYYFNRFNYFLEIYNADNTLLERIILEKSGINKDETKTYSYNINSETASQAQKIVFVNIPIAGYSIVDLVNDTLVCTNNYQTITYKFLENKLISIGDVINYNNSDYKDVLTSYQNKATNYNSINGVQSNIMESTIGFVFNTNIDLKEADISKLDNDTYYALDTEAKIVNFEMEARGFSCN